MRRCQWCSAVEGEKKFRHQRKNTCDSCGRMRDRSRCLKCNAPKFWGRCGLCDPPPEGKLKVILLDHSSDEERVIYRAVEKVREGTRISVASKRFYVDTSEAVVITLSRKDFLRTLC